MHGLSIENQDSHKVSIHVLHNETHGDLLYYLTINNNSEKTWSFSVPNVLIHGGGKKSWSNVDVNSKAASNDMYCSHQDIYIIAAVT